MMTNRNLTAMYDTRGAAEIARDELIGAGVAPEAISIHGTEEGAAASDNETAGQGFWASLANLFMPDEDRYTYTEGLKRGSFMLSALVPEDLEDAAADILEASEPVDLDERSASWRQEGWTGYGAGSPSYAGAPATAAYSEGAGLAEADPAFAPVATPVTARQEHPQDGSQPVGPSEGKAFAFVDNDEVQGPTAGNDEVQRPTAGKAFAFVDNDVVQAAEEELPGGKRDVSRGSVRVRRYPTEHPLHEHGEESARKPTGTGTVVEGSVVDPDLAGTNR